MHGVMVNQGSRGCEHHAQPASLRASRPMKWLTTARTGTMNQMPKRPYAMVRIQGTALLRISQSTCLAYFTSHGLQPKKIAKIVCLQADRGTIMGIIRSTNPIMIDLRQLSLEFLRKTHKKYFITHEKIWIAGASDRGTYFATVSTKMINPGAEACLTENGQ